MTLNKLFVGIFKLIFNVLKFIFNLIFKKTKKQKDQHLKLHEEEWKKINLDLKT